MKAIDIRELTKKYGDLTAVNALTLSVEAGELFALLGVNGAGKTTTIRMLTGLTQPTDGGAEVCGHSLTQEMAAVKRISGVSPQKTAIAPALTAKENIALMAGLYGKNQANANKYADELIARFSLESVKDRRAKVLSGGYQRRLSIAMAMAGEPKVLYLDEPTLGLDVLARRELWSILKDLKQHTTIILTTHYLEEAEALADRIGIMANGRLLAVDTAAALKAQSGCANFEDAFIKIVEEGTKQ